MARQKIYFHFLLGCWSQRGKYRRERRMERTLNVLCAVIDGVEMIAPNSVGKLSVIFMSMCIIERYK